MRLCERKNSADSKVSEEGGGERDARNVKAESLPLQLVLKTMVR